MADPCIELIWRDETGRASVLRFTTQTGALNTFSKAMLDALPPDQVGAATWRAVAGERSEEIARQRLLLRDYGRVIDDWQAEAMRLRRLLYPVIAEVSG